MTSTGVVHGGFCKHHAIAGEAQGLYHVLYFGRGRTLEVLSAHGVVLAFGRVVHEAVPCLARLTGRTLVHAGAAVFWLRPGNVRADNDLPLAVHALRPTPCVVVA